MDVQVSHCIHTKYRRKVIYNNYKEDIRDIIKILCKYKGVEIIEGHNARSYPYVSKYPTEI